MDPVNQSLHGISEQDLLVAPDFTEVWKTLEPYISNQVVVAHNCSFDLDVLISMVDDNEIELPQFRVMCSQKLVQEAFADLRDYRLEDAASYFGIAFQHHNSLSDARVSAAITIKALQSGYNFMFMYNHPELTKHIQRRASETKKDRSLSGLHNKKKISSELKQPNLDAANKEHPLYSQRIVFTGDLKALSRQEAAEKAQAIGADINTAISKKTNFVIVGSNAGPSKMKKITDLQSAGVDIRILNETEFLEMLNCDLVDIGVE